MATGINPHMVTAKSTATSAARLPRSFILSPNCAMATPAMISVPPITMPPVTFSPSMRAPAATPMGGTR